ncbi:MAG: hypothetical protein HQL51_01090 [Magnetococcales bacterium]|nr:hypothetical protein [Magnetococcales bacterium]
MEQRQEQRKIIPHQPLPVFDDHQERQRPVNAAGEGWTPLRDFFTSDRGRRLDDLPDATSDQRVIPAPEEPFGADLPPEARIPLLEAARQVLSVTGAQRPVMQRLQALQGEFRKMRQSGRCTEAALRKSLTALQAIRAAHTQETDALAEWYFNHHFRVFQDLDELGVKGDRTQEGDLVAFTQDSLIHRR